MEGGSGKLVFVTVGTTSFDELIQAATDEKLLKVCFKSDLLSMPNKPVTSACSKLVVYTNNTRGLFHYSGAYCMSDNGYL